MNKSNIRVIMALLAAMLSVSVASSQTPHLAAAAEMTRQDRTTYQKFAQLLLVKKRPRQAYEKFAAENFTHRTPPFAPSRESTIKQWETMTSRPGSRFEIVSIEYKGDTAVMHFLGVLDPSEPGAEVTQYNRLAHGTIVEEWSEFKLTGAPK